MLFGVNKSRDSGLRNLGNAAEKLNELKNNTNNKVQSMEPLSEDRLFEIFLESCNTLK